MTDGLPRRVGINAVFIAPRMGGLDTYVRELVPELIAAAPGTRFRIYTSPQGREYLSDAPWAGEVGYVSHPLFGTSGLKAASEMTVLGALASRGEDLLHSIALTAPLRTRAANVITIADTTWLSGPRSDSTTLLWRAVVPTIARHADRLIAISQASADDIVDRLHVPRDRVDLTILGHRSGLTAAPLAEDEVRRRVQLGDSPYVLMVGGRKHHKNVDGLLRGFAQARATVADAQLVLAGNPTSIEPDLLALADELGLSDSVHFLGFVDASELEGLYAAASLFVLPSHNEGFGLPVLEAMARGVPVACSSVSALPEVGGDAARYFDPQNPEQIGAVIAEVLSDEHARQHMADAGRRRAAGMTWAHTADATLESYRRAHTQKVRRV
jgi:glycosyltransferase involved in cell wall biosynthesis